MFGRMVIAPVLQLNPAPELNGAVTALLKTTETAEIARWVEFPLSVVVFLLVPGDPQSGAVYVLDRRKGAWYSVDFDDDQYGGYSVAQLEVLLKECDLLALVERPGLLRTGLPWALAPGKRAETAV